MKKKFIIIIPARYKSSRLPGKPLIEILGIPMLVRTYNQCLKVASREQVIVATDDKRISKLCEKRLNRSPAQMPGNIGPQWSSTHTSQFKTFENAF